MDNKELRTQAENLSVNTARLIQDVIVKHNMGVIAAALDHGREMKNNGPLNGKYGDVLRPFVTFMEVELHANTAKGDRPGWLKQTPEQLLLEIYWHTAKLSVAVKDNNNLRIREYSADVANMCMMLLDTCGGFDSIGDATAVDENQLSVKEANAFIQSKNKNFEG